MKSSSLQAAATLLVLAGFANPHHAHAVPKQKIDSLLTHGVVHMSMSFFRGLAEDRALEEWLNKFIFPAEARNVTRDFVTWGTKLSMLEMLRGGITTVADM